MEKKSLDGCVKHWKDEDEDLEQRIEKRKTDPDHSKSRTNNFQIYLRTNNSRGSYFIFDQNCVFAVIGRCGGLDRVGRRGG